MIEIILMIITIIVGIIATAWSLGELKRLKESDREIEASYFRIKWLLEELRKVD